MLQNNLVFLTYEWNPEKDWLFRQFHKHYLIIQKTDTENCKGRRKTNIYTMTNIVKLI